MIGADAGDVRLVADAVEYVSRVILDPPSDSCFLASVGSRPRFSVYVYYRVGERNVEGYVTWYRKSVFVR